MGLKEILCGTLLTVSLALGVGVDGFFIDTPNCSTKVYRKPTGPIDTLYAKTNFAGKWVIETNNFIPPSQIGDTLYVEGGWNLGKNAKTMHIVGANADKVYDLHLDKFTACVKDVHDSSHVNAPLKAIYSLQGVSPCTTEVDTGYDQGFTFYYDIHVPFDTLEATQGKPGIIRLEKTLADTTWYRGIPFTVSRERFDAQLVKDTVYFTRDSMTIGVAEENLEKRVRETGKLIIKPNPAKNYIISTHEACLYDALGRRVKKIDKGKNNLDLNSGVYFIKKEDDIEKLVIYK